MILKKQQDKRYITFFCLALFLLTFTVYLPALQNGFVNWDDDIYVYENSNIRSIGLDFIKWCFSDASVGHWQPVTWLSFSLDYLLWALNPLGFHLTNIIMHSLNTLLVFILAIRLIKEGSRGQNPTLGDPPDRLYELIAAFVTALLFGIHPVHTESVAWVTERKDVLSLLFFLMTILSYIKYNSSVGSDKRAYYCVTLILFIIALMTKPMIITLPIVLLVLDFYPMQRLGKGKEVRWILIEKIPFFLLSFISSLITIWAAGSAGAMGKRFTLITRLFLAVRGYLFYLLKMLFPINLAPLYPYPAKIDTFTVEYLGAAVLVLSITIYCLWSLRRGRLIFAVWLYYIVTLLPVIGIIHAGPQDTADRYTYLPSIGPFLLIGLAIGSVFKRYPKKIFSVTVLLILLSGILIGKTIRQIEVWHDSITLWTNEIRLFQDVYSAYYNRGCILGRSGRYEQSIRDLDRAIELDQSSSMAYNNRGNSYLGLRNYSAAMKDYKRAIELDPRNAEAYYNLGSIYTNSGDTGLAIINYRKAASMGLKQAQSYLNNINQLGKKVKADIEKTTR